MLSEIIWDRCIFLQWLIWSIDSLSLAARSGSETTYWGRGVNRRGWFQSVVSIQWLQSPPNRKIWILGKWQIKIGTFWAILG